VKRNIIVLTSLIAIAAIARFIPHGYNFTPLGGIALLGGAYYSKRILAFLVPILVLFVTDVILNNTLYRAFFPDQEGFVLFTNFMIYTYLGTAAIVLLGILMLKKVSTPRLLGGAVLGSLLFFLISNFGSWLTGAMYPKTAMGLLSAYGAGLPFLTGHLIANVIFAFLLFGLYELLVERRITSLSRMHL